jgi:hypothetical protein
MKTLISLKKNVLSGVLIALMTFSFSSCAVKSSFLNSSVVPAAQGNVKVKRDNKNQNYVIKIEVTDLAEVERLQTSKHNYVVWMETDQGKTENLGQLNSSSGFLSKKLKASLETVSSYQPAKIFITAEDNTDVQDPGTEVVLSTGNFNMDN